MLSTIVYAQTAPREPNTLGMREVEATVFATFPERILHNCIYACSHCTPLQHVGFAIAYNKEIDMFVFSCGLHMVGDTITVKIEEGI